MSIPEINPSTINFSASVAVSTVLVGFVYNVERLPPVNERITDRILESIQKAVYVIVDLTESRPNVFCEAGYAQGIGKVPIYIARNGTVLEFDLKDYPVIFFDSYRELKEKLEARLRGLSVKHA